MATEGKPVTDIPKFDYRDVDESIRREDAWWKKAKASGRRFINFQVADSYAHYEVTGEKRYTLHHVDSGDGYRVNPAMIRGLRKVDIDNMLRRDSLFSSSF